MAIKTTERDMGEKKLLTQIKKMKGAYVTVGIHKGEEPYPNGVEVPLVGFWHEFGTRKMPQRSFLRSAVAENRSKIKSMVEEQRSDVIFNKVTIKKSLEKLGFMVMSMIQAKIMKGPFKPLAESTLMAKRGKGALEKREVPGAGRPLVRSGRLYRSINFEVNSK